MWFGGVGLAAVRRRGGCARAPDADRPNLAGGLLDVATSESWMTFAAPSRRHSRIRRLVASVIESWSSTARAFLNRDRSRSPARVLGHPVGHARG